MSHFFMVREAGGVLIGSLVGDGYLDSVNLSNRKAVRTGLGAECEMLSTNEVSCIGDRREGERGVNGGNLGYL